MEENYQRRPRDWAHTDKNTLSFRKLQQVIRITWWEPPGTAETENVNFHPLFIKEPSRGPWPAHLHLHWDQPFGAKGGGLDIRGKHSLRVGAAGDRSLALSSSGQMGGLLGPLCKVASLRPQVQEGIQDCFGGPGPHSPPLPGCPLPSCIPDLPQPPRGLPVLCAT